MELPLAKFQCLKMQDFSIPLFSQKFFCLPTISHQQLSPTPINRTIFCDNSNKKRKPRKKAKTTTTAFSDILKTIGMGVNMITRQMTPFFSYIPKIC